jgi:hypothetical protein
VDSPCVLVAGEHGWSANMERIMKAQALHDNSTTFSMASKKSMELNPKHPIISEMRTKLEANGSDNTLQNLVWLMYETSLLTSGFTLDDPTRFSSRIHKLIEMGLSSAERKDKDCSTVREVKGSDREDKDNVNPGGVNLPLLEKTLSGNIPAGKDKDKKPDCEDKDDPTEIDLPLLEETLRGNSAAGKDEDKKPDSDDKDYPTEKNLPPLEETVSGNISADKDDDEKPDCGDKDKIPGGLPPLPNDPADDKYFSDL